MKKSYVGFWLYLAQFVALAILIVIFVPVKHADLMSRITLNYTTLQIEALMLVMYFADRVYWVNGISFEAAVEAGPERRKVYAGKLVKRFGIFALVFMAASVVLHLMHASIGNDIIIAVAGTIGCAISIITIKL